jgi:hypothetical protein
MSLESPHEDGKRGADDRKSQKPEHVDISRFGQVGGTVDKA